MPLLMRVALDQRFRTRLFSVGMLLFAVALCLSPITLTSCSEVIADKGLLQNTYVELVDWHISGLWVINCPVAWIRVANYNRVPIKDIVVQYNTYDYEGKPLNQATHTLEEPVQPGQVRNFIEQYLGFVDLHSDKLSIKLVSVAAGSH